MKPTIAEWISDSVERRKRAKKEIDSVIALSNDKSLKIEHLNAFLTPYEDTVRIRMIDEGAIPYDDGSVRLFLKKGAIQKFYDNLDSDYVGYVNIGHIDLESLPLLLGTWTKDDLHIVHKEDGRAALDADIHLNGELSIVQDLKKQGLPLSVSVEMYNRIDEGMSDKLQMPIVDEIFILGVSIVGSPANVNSTDVYLGNKGEKDMGLKEFINQLSDTEQKKETLEAEEAIEETVEEVAEEVAEESEVETLENEQEESTVEESAEEVEDEIENLSSDEISKLEAYIESLAKECDALKKENEELKEQLKQTENEKEVLSSNIDKSIGRIESLMEANKKDSTKESKKESLKNEPKVDGWMFRG